MSPGQVQYRVERARGKRLDRADFSDGKPGPRVSPLRTPPETERRVLELRQRLKHDSVLGEDGAAAIERALHEAGEAAPSRATINRILERHGATDAAHRLRRPAPPPGWYLPAVLARQAELDSFDFIEELKIAAGPLVDVLTGISLHGHQCDAWPGAHLGARQVVEYLEQRWRDLGLPDYAQFDNETRFQGAHQFPDTFGRVTRLCLALAVVPVFAPQREHGFQGPIEALNGLWQRKVWARWQHADVSGLRQRSAAYVQAHRHRNAACIERAPARRPWPQGWRLDLNARLRGKVIFLRRTDAHGTVSVLGHRWVVSAQWCHRLVRCEVDLDAHHIDFFALRRRAPQEQPLLCTVPYHPPDKPFKGAPQ